MGYTVRIPEEGRPSASKLGVPLDAMLSINL